ncbi:ankyrin repeat domain-containing protein [Orientia tsutsugamushi]|uniref:Ankyrin repeat-containing protein 13 n=1 Tax=Orientia tsutsugamushi TaxID=784 RepID=A0A2U3RCC8_ORITS|nr:ankyrin repeat domain-containing protein [Orientia tsutsugamushi]KJV55052.1 ankyrin repeat family protein [Orientia tsutsugamushi str. Kato PP]SPR10862.1 ankyrin repeat-containing protein 13 [Orientia tsutsugamushi]
MNTALSLAIKRGNIKAVLDILNENPGLVNFQQDVDFKTPLHTSVEHKQEEITKLLLERNANVTLQDNNGNTPLHVAARNHDLKTTEILLSYGNAIVDMQNNKGQTPLHLASTRPYTHQGASSLLSKESLSIAQALLTHGAKVNLQDGDGNTALHYATNSFHHKEITEILLNHGANVNAQNDLGDTALHRAAKNGLLPTVVCLLKSGASVHLKGENGNSVLHCAAQGRGPNESIVKAVLHHGADVNARNNNDSTPLHHAAEKIHDPLPAIQILLKHGADIDAHDNRNCTPLNNAISSSLIINMQTGIPEFLTSHITKLEYSSDKKTSSAGSLTNQQLIQQSSTLSEYKLACEKELKELSNIKVGGGQKSMLSAFLANTTNDNESSRYIHDPKVQEIYECCEEKFPIYSGALKEHIDAGSTRNQLLHGALESMDDICKEQPKEHSTERKVGWDTIPPEVKFNILKHLSNEDLSKIQQNKTSEAKKKDPQPSGHRCI